MVTKTERITEKPQIPLPIVIMKEGKWFVASCPIFDIATQGKTEEEVKENMDELIEDYVSDPDTIKPKVMYLEFSSFTIKNVSIPREICHGKIKASSAT